MSIAILDINDAHLQLLAGSGETHVSSGYVSFGSDMVFGEDAKAAYWLHPGRSDSKFWSLLSTAGWTPGHKLPVRHRADVAYAQLKQLWSKASANELVLLVPASFSDAQLGLLVGMCEALPKCKVSAVASSALLAAYANSHNTGNSEFVLADMGLHKVECYVFSNKNQKITEQQHRIFSELGEFEMEVSLARHIANRFIESHRYDPQHTAQSDQELHNAIPGWLKALSQQSSLTISLHTSHGEAQIGLQSSEVSALFARKLDPLLGYMKTVKEDVWVTSRLARWLQLAKLPVEYSVLDEANVVNMAAEVASVLVEQSQPLHRIKSIASGSQASTAEVAPKAKGQQETSTNLEFASHILIDNKVHPIHGLTLQASESGGVHVSRKEGRADLQLQLKNNVIQFVDLESDEGAQRGSKSSVHTVQAVAGESIEIFNKTYLLVNLLGNEN